MLTSVSLNFTVEIIQCLRAHKNVNSCIHEGVDHKRQAVRADKSHAYPEKSGNYGRENGDIPHRPEVFHRKVCGRDVFVGRRGAVTEGNCLCDAGEYPPEDYKDNALILRFGVGKLVFRQQGQKQDYRADHQETPESETETDLEERKDNQDGLEKRIHPDKKPAVIEKISGGYGYAFRSRHDHLGRENKILYGDGVKRARKNHRGIFGGALKKPARKTPVVRHGKIYLA